MRRNHLNILGHLRTITHHRHLVMLGCFRIGLIRQGLLHDLSKYTPTEFIPGAKYYLGNRSPNVKEREIRGYSTAWLHHKGRNKHHFEYWNDLNERHQYASVDPPKRYLAEMVMDRIAACKTYLGENYHPGSELEYLRRAVETPMMHPQTVANLEKIFTILRDDGEDAMCEHLRSMLKDAKLNGTY